MKAFSQNFSKNSEEMSKLKISKNQNTNFGPKGTTCKVGGKGDVTAEEIGSLKKTKFSVQRWEERCLKDIEISKTSFIKGPRL